MPDEDFKSTREDVGEDDDVGDVVDVAFSEESVACERHGLSQVDRLNPLGCHHVEDVNLHRLVAQKNST